MTDVKARKGDICAYRILAGGYMTAAHKLVEAQPVWRLGRVVRCDRDGVAQEVEDFRDGTVRKPKFSRVLIAPSGRFSEPAIARMVDAYRDRYTQENFATQGDFANAESAAEFVKGYAS